MSFNGSGVFVVNSAGQPVVATTLITAAAMNALTADLATGLSNCILKDGTQTLTQNIPFNAKKITGLGAGSARTDGASLATIQDGTGVYVATVAGTADAIELTPSPAITAYVAGQTFRFLASGANTTAVTVAVSGLVAKALTKNGTTALVAGDIPSASMVSVTYDGTRFIIVTAALSFSILDTAGDLIYASAADTAAKLAIGTARQALTVNAGATAPAWANPITIGTEQASTSGTSIDFTGIPAGVRRITIMFVGVSTNGSAEPWVQLGDADGFEASGYTSTIAVLSNVNTVVVTDETNAFQVSTQGATVALTGTLVLCLEDAAQFTWMASGNFNRSDTVFNVVAGSKSLSAELTQVRITTSNGSDAFDAGAININYE
jgi:hypothetical protein